MPRQIRRWLLEGVSLKTNRAVYDIFFTKIGSFLTLFFILHFELTLNFV